MDEKIVVFLCACGENIGGIVDLTRLSEVLASEPGVEPVVFEGLLCAPDGKAALVEKLRESQATRAVIAGCSPKDREADFRQCLEQAGLNGYLLQMANIREHCTWVTRDAERAFAKALSMTRAAIRRVRLHESLESREIECNPDVLVIGGGLAGIEAALTVSSAGRQVTLVESAPSIGGALPAFEEVAPNLECAPCLAAPRLSKALESPNLRLLTNASVTGIRGFFGNFEIDVVERARMVDTEMCMACDECMQVCPVSVTDDFSAGLAERKAVYVQFPGAAPNCAVVDQEACLKTQGDDCSACVEACPMEAMDFSQTDTSHELRAGAVIIATGAEPYDPSPISQLGLGSLENVVTLAQFERLTSSTGPTGGQLLKADGTPPKRVAIVHCAGREELGYCSGVCCQSSLKAGHIARKPGDDPDAAVPPEVVHLHTDLVLDTPAASRLLAKATDSGSRLVRVSDARLTTVAGQDDGLVVQYLDAAGSPAKLEADMVVLATGLVPREGTKAIAQQLGLGMDEHGFIAADHPVLRPAATTLGGAYVAGTAAGPKGFSASVSQAQAAVSDVLARLQVGKKLTIEEMTAHTIDEKCSRCMICVSVCPYNACAVDRDGERVELNELLCHGCGTCVAACPSGAADARHFTDKQIASEMEGVLHE